MKIIIILIIVYILNFMTSYYLHKKYIKALKRVRQYGTVSTSRVRGTFRKKGSIVLLAFDRNFNIQYGEIFNGFTIFSKFEEIKDIKNITVFELEEKYKGEKSILQAADYIKEKLNNDKEDESIVDKEIR